MLSGYRDQLQALYRKWDESATVSLEALLPLPGVVNDQSMILFSPEDDWPAISKVLQAALQNLAADADSRRPGHGR